VRGVVVEAGRGGLLVREGCCCSSPGAELASPVLSGGLPGSPEACVGPSLELPLAGSRMFAASALSSCVQRRAMKLVKDLEKKTWEEGFRVLEVCSLEKKKAKGRPYWSLQLPESRL